MPVVFANEYSKYQNKLEYQIGKGLFSSFIDVIKPSISPVVEIISNIREVKDNVTDKYDSKTSSDINTFNTFNKIKNNKPNGSTPNGSNPNGSTPKGVPIFNNPDIPDKDLIIFKKIIEETKSSKI